MIIIGDNLLGLISQESMCNVNNYDNTCISLSLGQQVIWLKPTDENNAVLNYGEKIPKEYIIKENIADSGLAIPPKTALLAASQEVVKMPLGYWGLLQTKGSLARMLISLHFSDGQIDPGYEGNVTFEIMNGSDFTIVIKKGQPVGNLYVFKASTDEVPPYNGRYQNAYGPTTQMV